MTFSVVDRESTGGYESDYVEGGNGGTINTFAGRSTILDGALSSHTVIGRHQIASGDLPTGATLFLGDQGIAKLSTNSDSLILPYGQGYLLTKDGFSLKGSEPDPRPARRPEF